jgi:hypothetical protein
MHVPFTISHFHITEAKQACQEQQSSAFHGQTDVLFSVADHSALQQDAAKQMFSDFHTMFSVTAVTRILFLGGNN